jgi:hypothetical protein
MEMLRRLCLIGVFVLIKRGSFMQLIIGSAFCALFLLLQSQASPYVATSDDYLANLCSCALLFFFLCCLVFKVC